MLNFILKENRFLKVQQFSEYRIIMKSKWFERVKNEKDSFFRLYDLDNTEEVVVEFNKHENCRNETGLRATTTILLNEYKLPDN